jgi:acetyl esterase/lipase
VTDRHKRRLPPAPSIAYGEHPDQVANLHLPAGEGGPWPCVMLIHGGFWRIGWDRTLMTPLAIDLARRGVAAWNVEYRRVGQEGGGWPGTFEDIAAAIDHLEAVDAVDATRVATCGHSAGGHLAFWLAARRRLPPEAPGGVPRVQPTGAVSQAGVVDLESGAETSLGSGACEALLGGAANVVPERFALASPAALLPLGVPMFLVHGGADDIVPLTQSAEFAGAAREAGDEVDELIFTGAGHFDVVDVDHPTWSDTAGWLLSHLAYP